MRPAMPAVMAETEESLASRIMDALDVGVVILSDTLADVLYLNAKAQATLGRKIPEEFRRAIRAYVACRRDLQKPPPPIRVRVGRRMLVFRVLPDDGHPPVEIVQIREVVTRETDALRVLREHWGVTGREHQVLVGVRLGKTNRQIAEELGIYRGTVARHVQRLLERFEVSNRTHLVDVVSRVVDGCVLSWKNGMAGARTRGGDGAAE